MATFVIVHGAWAGAWGWTPVTERLRARGHRVHVPTLSGLGERSHLAQVPIGLATHVDDIANEIIFNDLEDVVLVGHSYGGIVATGVAEKIGPKIASIVYLDAFVPGDGQGFVDFVGDWELSGQLTDPPKSQFGDYPDPVMVDWVNAKATPQPTKTLTDRLTVTGAYEAIGRKTYILAVGWDGFGSFADRFRGRPDWTVREIDCGHDVPLLRPDELVDMLEAAGPRLNER